MPFHPTWLERIPELLALLQAETAPTSLHRTDLEQLFRVRRRRAIGLLHKCGGSTGSRGRELTVTREAVVEFLEQSRDEEAVAQAVLQRQQVEDALAEARRALSVPRISVPLPAKLSEVTLAGLPPGIELTRSQLSVTFATAEDLVGKLFTLAQAFANDYESLESALADPT